MLRSLITLLIAAASINTFAHEIQTNQRFINVLAADKYQRSELANMGLVIEATKSDSVWGFADPDTLAKIENSKFKILMNSEKEMARGGHDNLFGFPVKDAKFHDYAELTDELTKVVKANPDMTRMHVIGKSLEGRDIMAININTSKDALERGSSGKPGIIFLGNHHAREHLSAEVPLMLIQWLMNNKSNGDVRAMLEARDIWIVPMVNPDGVEYDISTGSYKMWRKNRRKNPDNTMGVDLNRNYGFMWGTGGSSTSGSSDVFMGPEAFSEPETKTVRDFVANHLNAKVLLSFHTFSELILYPWGHKYDTISNERDLKVHETMAKTMAQWNHYTPEQSSALYIASGDTTDWSYGTYGIFSFTFELSPKSQWDGGFYPGASVIDRVFQDNLKPCLYLIDKAGDPYSVLQQ
jgi:carboxypeptidase T